MLNTDLTPDRRVAELVTAITDADRAYATGQPTMVDADYDALRDELAALLAERPDLTPDPNPLDGIWTPAAITAPVRHQRPMLSLAKVAPADRAAGVAAFLDSFPGVPVFVMPKLDGVSAAVVYRDGVLQHVATRGDGSVGENITAIAAVAVRDIPPSIQQPGTAEVRGELVMLRSTLQRYNASAAGAARPLMNTRNAAAGVLGLKDAEGARGRELHFVAFDLDVDGDSHARPGLDDELRGLGFAPAPMGVCAQAPRALELIDAFEAQRATGDIDTDGVVLRVADTAVYQRAGTRSNSARGAVAVKFAPEEKVTTLLDVQWVVGPGGKVVPRAVLERVLVAGTHITSATLANQAVIERRGVRIGQRVLLRRAGDVIPFVVGPAPGPQPNDLQDIQAPRDCPSCGQPLTEQGNSRELYCTQVACPAQGARRLMHWASRPAADIDAVGPVWIQRLYDAHALQRPEDFYRLNEADLLAFRGMAETSAQRMLTSIDQSRQIGLRRALIGLGIRHAREGTAKRLCRAGYETIEQVAGATSRGATGRRGHRDRGRRQHRRVLRAARHPGDRRGAARRRRQPRRPR